MSGKALTSIKDGIAGMTGMCHYTQPLVEMESTNFLPGLPWNCGVLDICLPSS
jgi:hypothetical protein